MSTVEELREERLQREGFLARVQNAEADAKAARRAEESAARAERRGNQAKRQLVTDKQSEFGADLIATFEELKSFVARRDKLVRSRREVVEAERAARAAGITLDHSYVEFETAFLSSPEWRRLHDELRLILGSGKILG